MLCGAMLWRRLGWHDKIKRAGVAVCIGHSHAACVAAAAAERGVQLLVLNFWQMPGAVIGEGSHARFAPFVIEQLHAPVFSMIGGAVHHDIGLLLPLRPFDFIDPAEPHLPRMQDATLIPYHAVLKNMRVRATPFLRLMDCVRAAVHGPMYHMQSPAIFAGEAPEEDKPDWVAYYGPGRRVSPAPFRRKLWRMHSMVVREHCAASDIHFVPCPAESLDIDGYLRSGLNGRPAHANEAYGAMVLNQILKLA